MGADAGEGPRIGIAGFGDLSDPAVSSGAPGAIQRGLRDWGATPVPLPVEAPAPVRLPLLAMSAARARSRLDAPYLPEQFAVRGAVLKRRLRRAQPLTATISLGADVELPAGSRYVLMSDMTLALARRVHPVFARLSERVAAGWDARQRRIYHDAAAVCTASHWCAESVIRDYGVPPERVHVVGFGANHEPPLVDRDWTNPRFLFVGREWERKNGPLLMRVFAHVRAEHPGAELDVVGGHPPLDMAGVRGHGPLRLSAPEERAQVEALFARTTCFVMPSVCEPFGIAYVEAARAGVASIATTIGGAGTAVGDGGMLVEPTEDGVLTAMRRLCDPATASRLGEAARRHSELLTWRRVTGRILRAIDPPGLGADPLPGFL
jgi:glycosyltransferase involved in cell wall biosynthesis